MNALLRGSTFLFDFTFLLFIPQKHLNHLCTNKSQERNLKHFHTRNIHEIKNRTRKQENRHNENHLIFENN